MYAIIEASGKQFRAEPDGTLRIPRLPAEPGDTVTFEVLLAETNGDVHVGQPSLEGSSVSAEVIRHGRGDKVVVFKRKRRKNYRKKQGHRQDFTEVRITGITIGAPKSRKRAKPEKEPPAAEAAATMAEAAPAEAPTPGVEVEITGAARKLAEEHGLDLAGIEGSGAGGRILKGDVEKAIREQADEG
ncbi:MAG: 50S ribosomal protein L21 [Gemmatimonadota bacterium]|jgi:large subunit ribosomal protein L21|nr:MAG: 50S ribosomal protein L21 [Gemmatimonadota bacterium]